jgi:hypothetical protein
VGVNVVAKEWIALEDDEKFPFPLVLERKTMVMIDCRCWYSTSREGSKVSLGN